MVDMDRINLKTNIKFYKDLFAGNNNRSGNNYGTMSHKIRSILHLKMG